MAASLDDKTHLEISSFVRDRAVYRFSISEDRKLEFAS